MKKEFIEEIQNMFSTIESDFKVDVTNLRLRYHRHMQANLTIKLGRKLTEEELMVLRDEFDTLVNETLKEMGKGW